MGESIKGGDVKGELGVRLRLWGKDDTLLTCDVLMNEQACVSGREGDHSSPALGFVGEEDCLCYATGDGRNTPKGSSQRERQSPMSFIIAVTRQAPL